MMPTSGRQPVVAGVVPAIYTTFKNDDELSIDDAALQRLTDRVVSVDGVRGIFCTGHAGEVSSLSRRERERVVRLVNEATNGRVPVLAGIYSDDLNECIEHARDAKKAGATVVTIFPPKTMYGAMDTERVYRWFEAVAKGAKVPICIFLFPMGSGLGYSTETLVRLAELPEVVAVKEGSGNPRTYEDNVLALSSLASPVRVLTSNNEWWLADLALAGGDGILSGSGPVLAREQIEIYRAITDGNLRQAQNVHARIRPLLRAFYNSPMIDTHNRMKVALKLMGILPHATVRPPLRPLDDLATKQIARALEAAGVT